MLTMLTTVCFALFLFPEAADPGMHDAENEEEADDEVDADINPDIPLELRRMKWEVIAVLQSHTIRQSNEVSISDEKEPTQDFSDLSELLSEVDVYAYNSRRLRWIAVEWKLPTKIPVDQLYSSLNAVLNKHSATRYFAIGTFTAMDGSEMALAVMYKKDFRSLKDCNLTLTGVLPTRTFRVNYPEGKIKIIVEQFFLTFIAVVSQHATTLDLEDFTERCSMEHLYSQTAHLSDAELNELSGNIHLITPASRSSFMKAMLKVGTQLKQMRQYRRRAQRGDVITMDNCHRYIQHRSVFNDTWMSLPLELTDSSLAPGISPTLADFIELPGLHQNITLLMLGETRLGKTELAKWIAMLLSRKYLRDMASVLFINTIEAMKPLPLVQGAVIIMDDVEPWSEQLAFSDPAFWKSLLQSTNSADLHARYSDISIPSRVMKIITSNCVNVAEWMGKLCKNKPEHTNAISKRLAVCRFEQSVYAGAASTQASGSFMPGLQSTAEAATDMARILTMRN